VQATHKLSAEFGDLPEPAAPEAYQSRVFASREHEDAAMRFFANVGFRNLTGRYSPPTRFN
jgi:hypothetical protein